MDNLYIHKNYVLIHERKFDNEYCIKIPNNNIQSINSYFYIKEKEISICIETNKNTTETNALSICLGILLEDTIENKKFCFLWHSLKLSENEDNDLYQLLAYSLEKVTNNLKSTLLLQLNAIDDLTLLTAGDAVEEHQLTRKACVSLNQNTDPTTTIIENLTTNPHVFHIFKKLKNSVIILQPVTCAQSLF